MGVKLQGQGLVCCVPVAPVTHGPSVCAGPHSESETFAWVAGLGSDSAPPAPPVRCWADQ